MSTKLALESSTPSTATFSVKHTGKDAAPGVVVCRSFDERGLALVDSEPVVWEDDKTGVATCRRIEGCVEYDAYVVDDPAGTDPTFALSDRVEF